MRHELVKLTCLIDWNVIGREWAGFFPSNTRRPATPPHLVASLCYLRQAYAMSDEAAEARWAESRYWQYFCGEVFLLHLLQIDPSSMTRWRQRIGAEGVEWLLTDTIEAGKRVGTVKGETHKRSEFRTKVSVATSNRAGFVVGMCVQTGNSYDGHTLIEALEQVGILTNQRPEFVFVDGGCRRHGVENVKVFISDAKRGVTRIIA